jgi:hypothetical protein
VSWVELLVNIDSSDCVEDEAELEIELPFLSVDADSGIDSGTASSAAFAFRAAIDSDSLFPIVMVGADD